MIPSRQPEGPFLSLRSNASGRHATLEDDGYSAWLYLTRQSTYEVIATALVYSRVELPEYRLRPFGKNRPPLLLRQFATPAAVHQSVPEEALPLSFPQTAIPRSCSCEMSRGLLLSTIRRTVTARVFLSLAHSAILGTSSFTVSIFSASLSANQSSL